MDFKREISNARKQPLPAPTPSKGTPNPTVEEIMEIADEMVSHDLIEACMRVNAFDWGRQYLYPVISQKQRKEFFPSDEDLSEQLDAVLQRNKSLDLARHAEGTIYSYFSQGERHGSSPQHLLDVFLNWLAMKPEVARFQLAIAAVHEHGKRADFQRLNTILLVSALPEDERNKLEQPLLDAQFTVLRRSLT